MDKPINSLYSYSSIASQMAEHFSRNGNILLKDFLSKEFYSESLNELKQANAKEEYIPDRYSHSVIEAPEKLKEFLQSGALINFLSEIIGKKINKIDFRILKFKHRDFSIIHDEINPGKRTEAFFIFSDGWNSDFGGSTIYTKGDGEPLIFGVDGNILCLVKADEDTFSFVKYVNHFSEGKEFFKVEIIIRHNNNV